MNSTGPGERTGGGVSSSQEIRSDGWQRDVGVLRRQVAAQQHEIERPRLRIAEAGTAGRERPVAAGEHLSLFSAAAAIDRMLMASPCYGEHHQNSDVELARVALDAATPFIVASERERTCQLAETRHATYQDHNGDSQPFADLLTGETP